jgi:hypothetical protein
MVWGSLFVPCPVYKDVGGEGDLEILGDLGHPKKHPAVEPRPAQRQSGPRSGLAGRRKLMRESRGGKPYKPHASLRSIGQFVIL